MLRAVLVVLVAVAVAASPHDDALQPAANVQAVTLTGHAPDGKHLDVKVQAGEEILDTERAPISLTPSPSAAPSPSVTPTSPDNGWYTRAELLRACGLPTCEGTEHCWGNPSSFMSDWNTARPDGTHHEVCCYLADARDVSDDPTQIVPAVEKCYNNTNRGARGWCMASESAGMTSGQRCELHGGVPVWNYHRGRIHKGPSPDGRCMTLLEATNAFYTAHDSDYLAKQNGRDKCIGRDGVEYCCGHGRCVWHAHPKEWACEFDRGYPAEQCIVSPMTTEVGSRRLTEEEMRQLLAAIGEFLKLNEAFTSLLRGILTAQDITKAQMDTTMSSLNLLTNPTETSITALREAFPALATDPATRRGATNFFNAPPSLPVPSEGQADTDLSHIDPSELMAYIAQWSSSFTDQIDANSLGPDDQITG